MLMCIQNLDRLCQFVLKILSGNEILMSIKGCNSVKILQKKKKKKKKTCNDPKLCLVIVYEYTNFRQILSILSQDIEWKPNIHGITE